MKWSIIGCLGLLVASLTVTPAHAGRRARRAARTTAVVAAATATRSSTTTAAAAPVVSPRRPVATTPVTAIPTTTIVRSSPVPYAASPDLTVTEVAALAGDTLRLTVKNIGQAPSPEAMLQVDIDRSANGARVATKSIRVQPLLVQQSVQITLTSTPLGNVKATAIVDPLDQVAESNEQNNAKSANVIAQPAEPPAMLEDVQTWEG